jgi:hypothetical protein
MANPVPLLIWLHMPQRFTTRRGWRNVSEALRTCFCGQ